MSTGNSNTGKEAGEPETSTSTPAPPPPPPPALVPAIEVHENVSRCTSPNLEAEEADAADAGAEDGDGGDDVDGTISGAASRDTSPNARSSLRGSVMSTANAMIAMKNASSGGAGGAGHFLGPFFGFGSHSIPDNYRRSSIGVEYLTARTSNSEGDADPGTGTSKSNGSGGSRTSIWSNANFLQPFGDKGGKYQPRRRSSQAKICTLECALCRKVMLSALSDRNLSAIDSVSTLSESRSCELHAGEAVASTSGAGVADATTSAAGAAAGSSGAEGAAASAKVTISEDVINAQGTSTGSTTGPSAPKKPNTDADRSMTPAELALLRTDIQEMMNKCWPQESGDRPDFEAFKEILHNLQENNDTQGIILALNRLEEYANSLEHLVEDRTNDFFDAKHKAEALLYQVMPRSVAQELISGLHPRPQHYDSVTINFIDIVGFTTISAASSPIEIIDFLNDLYNCFDYIIGNFDVYKVETIGDSYMVASGLPVRNGDRHALEISRMSLALLEAVDNFVIHHMPEEKLKVRIGIHSGPCAAGVVGHKMPRYCLFGDTVNTASRMESTGTAQKIHISYDTYKILKHYTSFEMKCRGRVHIKGKGEMTTYWLHGERDGPKIPKFLTETTTADNESEEGSSVQVGRSRTPALLNNGVTGATETSSTSNGSTSQQSTSTGSGTNHSQRLTNLLSNVAHLLHRLNDVTVVQIGRHFARAGGHTVCTGNCHRKHSDTCTDTDDITDFDYLTIREEDFIAAWRKTGKKRSQETGKSDVPVEKDSDSEAETDDEGEKKDGGDADKKDKRKSKKPAVIEKKDKAT